MTTKQIPVSVHPEIKSEPLDSTALRSIKPKSVTKPCKNDSKLSGTVQCLPPIRNSTVLRSPSEGSDSSDRITAWLENTSQINFAEHPVPGTNVAENILDEQGCPSLNSTKSNSKQDSIIKSGISGKTKEAKKMTILERVKSNTGTPETKGNNILDELLPKHASHKGRKPRYAPYKGATSKSQTKSRKVEPSPKEKTSVRQKTEGKESDSPIKFTVKQTNVKPNVSRENVFKIKKSNFKSVFVPRANASQAQAKGLPVEPRHTGNAALENDDKNDKFEFIGSFQHEDALSMDEEECVSLAASLPDSEVADMEIDNAEQYEKEIVQKVFAYLSFLFKH